MRRYCLESIDTAQKVIAAADSKQASDILLLDTGRRGFTDFFVICSGETDIHLDAIENEIVHSLKKGGILPLHREGSTSSGWKLIDYGDVVVHIFIPEKRRYYGLEELWHEASTVLRIP